MNSRELQLENYEKEPMKKNGCSQYKILVGYSIIECGQCDHNHLDVENMQTSNSNRSDLSRNSFVYDFKTSNVMMNASRLNATSIDVLYCDQNAINCTAEHVGNVSSI